MATFEFLRVSLAPPDQEDMFREPATRRQYLEKIFRRQRWDFEFWKKRYSLTPEFIEGSYAVARVGRLSSDLKHDGPDTDWQLIERKFWNAAWLFFDMSSDSQLVAMEKSAGSPVRLLRAFFEHVENDADFGDFEAYVEYVADRKEFWQSVERNLGHITRLEFTFVPPNALGADEKVRDLVDLAAKAMNADQTKIAHVNKDGGLHPESDGDGYVEAAMRVAGEGAGSVTMKAGRKVIYSSSKNRKTEEVPDGEVPPNTDKAGLLGLVARLFQKDQNGG